MKACLGFDTSCYTSSTALFILGDDETDGTYRQERKLLSVKAGERGLMQSEAVFQHIRNLPALLDRLLCGAPLAEIAAVCASGAPRPAVGSYMPVFEVGKGYAQSIASALRVPFYLTTHQEGHIQAGLVGTKLTLDDSFLALHLSGGTTEVLHVARRQFHLVCGTGDLHAGQLIDRIGVKMGLPFPAGPSLERLAMKGDAKSLLPSTISGGCCHFSGAEAQALRWLAESRLPREDVAAEIFDCIARTVVKLILFAAEQAKAEDVVLCGGVASSAFLSECIRLRMAKRAGAMRLHFAKNELSGDNAVGVAGIGAKQLWGAIAP